MDHMQQCHVTSILQIWWISTKSSSYHVNNLIWSKLCHWWTWWFWSIWLICNTIYDIALRWCYLTGFTEVKHCTLQWLISNDTACKERVFNGLVIHHLIMITCISYEIIFTISPSKLINIASLLTCVIHVTDSIRHCNIDYSGLEWSNIKTFWYWYGKYIFIADAGNYN